MNKIMLPTKELNKKVCLAFALIAFTGAPLFSFGEDKITNLPNSDTNKLSSPKTSPLESKLNSGSQKNLSSPTLKTAEENEADVLAAEAALSVKANNGIIGEKAVKAPVKEKVRTKPNLIPLYFDASRNNIRVLPQRFEYALWDEDRFSVGDILVDSTQLTFKINPLPNKPGYNDVSFTWPGGLLKSGNLTIRDNSGKTIFVSEINKENIKLSKGTPMEDHENLRSDIASFTAEALGPEFIESIKYLPFLSFCVSRDTEGTKLNLCSKELYLSKLQGQLTIKPRNLGKKVAHVDINGANVGNQGIIYLNESTEALNFRAQTQSGSFLEIETRTNDVDFKDVIQNGENFTLIATGAEPIDEKLYKRLTAKTWTITLPKDRPIIYLKGNGDFPMRQEFNIKGKLPEEADRAFMSNTASSKTYESSLAVQVTIPKNYSLEIPTDEKSATLEKKGGQNYLWKITSIPTGNDKRFLKLKFNDDSFTVRYDTARAPSYSLDLGGNYILSNSSLALNINAQWWFEKFLLIDRPWSKIHWGTSLNLKQSLASDAKKMDLTTIELLWRKTAGFQMEDQTWGLSLPFQMISVSGGSTSMLGMGAFMQGPLQIPKFTKYANFYEIKGHFYLFSTSDAVKISSGLDLSADAFKTLSDKWNLKLRYGVGLDQHSFDSSNNESAMQLQLSSGIVWKF